MIKNQEEDEFIAVRVQDPRVQSEGSWNSYVDYKIFLHTNSKAFTAKTSCVRRRYSEFAWLRKKLQKNAGLVPVPELPGKSLFSFNNEDFLERRRKGLQVFLDKVVHMTVCLSDSQLHLFLQTELPIGHIQDCVQGHTPYTVTDAILTYASSNRGFAQAQEEDLNKEPSLIAVPYESMESPAPHVPTLQNKDPPTSSDPNPLEAIVEIKVSHTDKSSLKVLQKNNHLEAIVKQHEPATFFLGDSQDDLSPQRASPAQQTLQMGCRIQTPVEVHSPMGTGFEDDCELEKVNEEHENCTVTEESLMRLVTAKETVPSGQSVCNQDSPEEAGQTDGVGEVALEKFSHQLEVPEQCASPEEERLMYLVGSEESVPQQIHSDRFFLKHVTSENKVLEHGDNYIPDINCSEESQGSDEQTDLDSEQWDDLGCGNEAAPNSEICGETHNMSIVPEVEDGGNEAIIKKDSLVDQGQQEVDLVKNSNNGSSEEDRKSLLSSDESITKISDEESMPDETEDIIQSTNGYLEIPAEEVTHWPEVEASSRDNIEQQMNGNSVEEESISNIQSPQEKTNRVEAKKDEALQHTADIISLAKTLDLKSTGPVDSGDWTQRRDANIPEVDCVVDSTNCKSTEQIILPSSSSNISEEGSLANVRVNNTD
ncbi:sorting nexin-11 [Lampris incognitus]|uniref:sorting nexin-11 n=1 Tax=Lampris incognitus TaxID=2546036 RepID=UPI0024B5C430|nr:sorting nexin-11 [Lampris incognitus]XP_056153145.1 sorting nexin-11 [Lampris incognitus]